MDGLSQGIALDTKIIVSADVRYPGSTALTLYEEIVHTFQPSMTSYQAEMQAKLETFQWAQIHNITVNPNRHYSADYFAYVDGGEEGLRQWLLNDEHYGPRSNRIMKEGMLYGK